ncbi:dTDP-4-dehydrorhamnose reductase [Tamaricihabitans halophyticus]|uniref:dTDP-4-dehydrorhamnose reductase n=1 Tax=Tamaricihabitans halophyticus TaxID=1262583 RepID=A0A4R2R341_9PSEU|nr:dTDP-4-dehydrorhamnose reductase [Tamaricihabitans halophyticus]TCP56089.1 dTDP-4-dehydrorhamnose reductase [Tamaricihabitans halophyticus]
MGGELAILVPGGTGQLGTELARTGLAGGASVEAPGSAELNVAEVNSVLASVAGFAERARGEGRHPVVINAAAYTAVDAAEQDEAAAFAVNADGPRVLAAACAAHRVPLLHVSTDYVFDGTASEPYEPDDQVRPTSAYGRTKLAGEQAVLRSGARAWVVRTSWVYGGTGQNFVRTMVRLAGERAELSVVDDQRGAPTWAADLAAGLVELAEWVVGGHPPEAAVLHCTNGGATTWYEFARAIFSELGTDPDRVRPCGTADFPRPAARPAYSVLSAAAWQDAGLTPPRPWREALTAFFVAHGEQLRGGTSDR